MSVGFARAVADGLRYNRVTVTFEPGWERKGNGQSFPNGKPLGLLTHHTGGDYGSGLSVLVNGRPDLSPPLCNNCTYPDGRIHIIAAHPANHAGASGGKSMGPLPTTTSFNRLMWGNEIMYPGSTPMTREQYRSACILGGVISGILGYTTTEYCRLHAETSVTGKWDAGAGKGPGIPLDGRQFRADIWPLLTASHTAASEEEDMLSWEVSGRGRKVIICPTGSMSANKREAWLSAAVAALTGPGWIQVYAQGPVRGVNDWRWTEKDLAPAPPPDNHVRRPWKQIKDGTTHLVVSWDLGNASEGASLCLETIPTA